MLKKSVRVNEKKIVSYYLEDTTSLPKLDLEVAEIESVTGADNLKDLTLSSCFIDEFKQDIESLTAVFQLISFKPLLCKAINAKTANRKLGYTALLLALVLVLLVFPALMIITGVHNLERCPVQRMLPIWLITIASVVLANGVFNFVLLSFLAGYVSPGGPSTLSSSHQPPPRNRLVELQRFLHLVVLVFHIVWLFLGTIWTMNLRSVIIEDARNADLLCNKLFFQTVFAHLIGFWLAVAVLLSIACFYIAKKLTNLVKK